MRFFDWRYAVVCVLVGVAVCAVTGAITGAVVVLAEGGGAEGGGTEGGSGEGADRTGPLLAVAFGSMLAGLIIGAALGALLGGLSGLVATLAVGRRTALGQVSLRVGLAVLLTSLVLLTALAGLTQDSGWQPLPALHWVGVVVPSVLAALGAARAAREVPGMRAAGSV